MRFNCDAQGSWLVNPRELAKKLGIPAALLKEEQALGLVRSRVVAGDRDEGLSRVTVQALEVTWEGTFDRRGKLISERLL